MPAAIGFYVFCSSGKASVVSALWVAADSAVSFGSDRMKRQELCRLLVQAFGVV